MQNKITGAGQTGLPLSNDYEWENTDMISRGEITGTGMTACSGNIKPFPDVILPGGRQVGQRHKEGRSFLSPGNPSTLTKSTCSILIWQQNAANPCPLIKIIPTVFFRRASCQHLAEDINPTHSFYLFPNQARWRDSHGLLELFGEIRVEFGITCLIATFLLISPSFSGVPYSF